MTAVPEPKNLCGGSFGAVYDFYIEREPLARLVGRTVWGIDVSAMYASMAAIGRLADGATVLDVPCGGGVAFRALRADQRVRYIAVDLSQEMLVRAQRRARTRSLDQVETVKADMCALPFPDAIADLCLSYSGLHAVPEPEAAVAELARCLKPGGELVGSMFCWMARGASGFLLGVVSNGASLERAAPVPTCNVGLSGQGLPNARLSLTAGLWSSMAARIITNRPRRRLWRQSERIAPRHRPDRAAR
jgi:SAM-dependent methyltransferase